MSTREHVELHFPHRHLLTVEGLKPKEILSLLDLAEHWAKVNREVSKKRDTLRGRTQINLFFEASTRTQSSFELAGKRLGADVMNMSVSASSVSKGETLLDTAVTLNAMRPDILIVRHHAAGAVELLAQKVDCSVVNAGDGAHQHPTQALLDALTIRRNKGRIDGLTVAICGDILHSRVARSNIILLTALGARVRVIAPSTLLPSGIDRMGVEVHRDMRTGLKDADIVNVIRLIADVTGENIITSEDVKGKVTVRLRNVPWEQALDIVRQEMGADAVILQTRQIEKRRMRNRATKKTIKLALRKVESPAKDVAADQMKKDAIEAISVTTPITSAALKANVAGVVRFDLLPGFYTWEFLSVDGAYVDRGEGSCTGKMGRAYMPYVGRARLAGE